MEQSGQKSPMHDIDREEETVEDVEMVDAEEEEDDDEVREENLDATDIGGDDERENEEDGRENGDEDRENGDNEEDSSTRPGLENFNDFQFDPEKAQDSGSASIPENNEAKLAGLWGSADKVLTAKINRERRFVCVDYPGVVQNLDKALATLENRSAISNTLMENGRLPIYFRPEDPFCKPVYANCTFSQNLLVRLRRRKKKNWPEKEKSHEAGVSQSQPHSVGSQGEDSIPSHGSGDGATDAEEDPYEYQLVVEGVVDRMYSFDALCDFQYLPVIRMKPANSSSDASTAPPAYREIMSSIVPQFEDDRHEYLTRQVPLFLPPVMFSRRAVPIGFQFDDDQPSSRRMDLIETERKKRFLGTIHLTYDHKGVPSEPHPEGGLSLIKLPKSYREAGVESIKKMFASRPLWSKSGLQANMEPKFHRYLTYLLPMAAFYFTNGAWKNLWCRFGFDPRTNPEAKAYQTIDFRIRKLVKRPNIDGKRELEIKGMIKLPDSSMLGGDRSGVQYNTNLNATYASKMTKDAKELVYVFRQGHLPPYRQMRYQVCDVHHPEVQAKMHENDGKETTCTERDGWCVPDFTDICRDILNREVEKLQALYETQEMK